MIAFNPKGRFLEMKDILGPHRDLVVRTSFTLALELALLSYQKRLLLAKTSDPVISAAQAQRLIGAQDFIDELLNLGEKVEVPAKQDNASLNYKV